MCGEKKRGARTSVYRGVSWNRKNRKWQAAINVFGGYVYLGLYVDEVRAAECYDKACLKVRGLRCHKVNFPARRYLDAAGQLLPDAHVDRLIQKAKQQATARLLSEAFDGGDNDAAADEGGGNDWQQPWQAAGGAPSDVSMAATVNNTVDSTGTVVAADGSAGQNSASRSEASIQQARQLGVKMAVLKQRLGRRRTAGLEQELLAALQAAQDDAESQNTADAVAPMPPAATGAQLAPANSIGGARAVTNSSPQLPFGGSVAGFFFGGSTHVPPQQVIQEPAALQQLPAPSQDPRHPALVPGTAGQQLALPSIQELLQCEAEEGAALEQLQAQLMAEVAALDAGTLLQHGDWSMLAAAAPEMAAAAAPQMGSSTFADGSNGNSSRHETSSDVSSSAGAPPVLLQEAAAGNGLSCMDITWLTAQVPESCQLRHVINHTGGLFGILYATRTAAGSERWGTALWDGFSFTHSSAWLSSAEEAARVCSQVLQMSSAAARCRQMQRLSQPGDHCLA